MPAILPPVPSQGPFHPLDTPQQLTAGNDAKLADGTALVWLSSKWPNLAGATLTMVVGHDQVTLNNVPATWTGTLPGTPASPTTAHLDVLAAQSATVGPGEYDYLLTATLTSGDKVTLAEGKLTVRAVPGNPTLPLTV